VVKGERRGSGGLASNRANTGVVAPIGARQRQRVLAETERFVDLAGQIFSRRFDRVPVLFDLSGTSAGMFRVAGGERWIRYNPWIFAKYFRENLEGTVPHEVAHYIVHEVFGRGIKPHGSEWRALMGRFGADPGVTFRLDLSGIPQRRQHTHPYRCACRTHQISSTRHNRVLRHGVRYHCRFCDGELTFEG
jgi:SprT protein